MDSSSTHAFISVTLSVLVGNLFSRFVPKPQPSSWLAVAKEARWRERQSPDPAVLDSSFPLVESTGKNIPSEIIILGNLCWNYFMLKIF